MNAVYLLYRICPEDILGLFLNSSDFNFKIYNFKWLMVICIEFQFLHNSNAVGNFAKMHPRNLYFNNPPDFKTLAAKYPDFRKHCIMELNGNITVDFKSGDAVRALTVTLLQHDFHLSIDLPSNSLVPRVPQKLNYILWLQDLLRLNSISENVVGIDIGTGASCIYPLLGASQFGWSFVATDLDQSSVENALNNVEKNKLQDKIQVVKVDKNVALCGFIENFLNSNFDFCMCNPPFYDNQVADFLTGDTVSPPQTANRNNNRPEPHSATVAKATEISVEGGELAFVSRIIDDSVLLKDRIKIFTSMVGKKSSILPLKKKLQSVNVANMTTTTFSQGRTLRWALAWTFQRSIQLFVEHTGLPKKTSFKLCIPETAFQSYDFETVQKWLLENLKSLEISVEETECCNESAVFRFAKYSANAVKCTWSHQRRKRRGQKVVNFHTKRSKPNREDYDDDEKCRNPTANNSYEHLSTKPAPPEWKTLSQPLTFDLVLKKWEKKFGLEFVFVSGENSDQLHQVVQYFQNQIRILNV